VTGLALARAYHATFGPDKHSVPIPELLGYWAERLAPYGVAVAPQRYLDGNRNSVAAMSMHVVEQLRPPGPLHLMVAAHATQDCDPFTSLSGTYARRYDDGALVMAVSDQGRLAPFTGLRLAQALPEQQAIIVALDQSSVCFDDPELADLNTTTEHAVGLLLTRDGPARLEMLRQLTGLGPTDVAAATHAALAGHAVDLVITGTRVGRLDGLDAVVRRAPVDQLCSAVWSGFAGPGASPWWSTSPTSNACVWRSSMSRPTLGVAMAPALLHDLLDATARLSPAEPAVRLRGGTLTYGELQSASRRAADWLSGRGVGRGDRVVIAASTHAVHAPLVYGCSRAGAVFVVLHEQIREHGLIHVLDDAEPTLLITDDPLAQAVGAARGIPTVSCADAERQIAASSPVCAAGTTLSVDPVCLIYTSGSTGMPKAVVSTHAQVLFATQAIQSRLGYRRGDIVFGILPLSFDYGLYQLFIATAGGACVHLGTAEDAGPALLTSLRQSGATVLASVPSIAKSLATLLERSSGGVLPLRLLTNTGAAMPQRTLDVLRERLPDMRIQLMFGLTECKRVSITEPDEDVLHPGSCGRPLPDTEVLVLNEDGGRVPPGTVGELVIRGPHVMAGYWRRPEMTAARFRRRDGLFPQLHTGDYGWLDEEGRLYFSGRRDDIYKSRGFRVSATEVEAAVLRLAGVSAAAVLPPTTDRPTPVLFSVAAFTSADLLKRLREEIEPYKVPAWCIVLDALPLNANGKTDKVALAALVADRTLGSTPSRA
jgi:amino acid adenylation domain-containing protein